jgi:acyl-CoA synthetase (NDP forming)
VPESAHGTNPATAALLGFKVIAVPAAAVIEVARECGSSGVPAVVVISAGFAETGPGGATT